MSAYNTIQYNTIQYTTIQYNTIQYNTIQYNAIQYNTIQYNTIQYNAIQYNTIIGHFTCPCLHTIHCNTMIRQFTLRAIQFANYIGFESEQNPLRRSFWILL